MTFHLWRCFVIAWKTISHLGFQDVLEALPKYQYKWFKSLGKKQKQLIRQIIRDEFKHVRESTLLKAAREGKLKKIVKTGLKKLKKEKFLASICFSGESTVQTRRGGIKWNQL